MADRPKIGLPFGAGLERASGMAAVAPAQFGDLRNADLVQGRTMLRKGATRTLLFSAGTDLLGVWPIRAQAVAAAIVYDSVSGDVDLYNVDATGAVAVFVDTLWTLPAGAAAPPTVVCADAYDKLLIAHAEPSFAYRQSTMVYDPIASTLAPLMNDFAGTGAVPVKFFGVARHLAYMLGWGYGQAGSDDSGYTLRISLPGEPATFQAEHYFQVGERGDPVIGGGVCGAEFVVQKASKSYKLIGYDRASFGIRQIDGGYGLVGARLHASTGDEYHHWSTSGPRYTTGGATGDLALPLELDGEIPDALATAVDTDKGFAYHDPVTREVVYVFGRWAFVLHARDGQRRWSYREFAVPLTCAGLLYIGGVETLVVPSWPLLASVSTAEPAYTLGDHDPHLTATWTIGGAPAGTEQCEMWAKPSSASVWTRIAVAAASALTISGTVPEFWTTYQIALRFTIGGLPGAGYSSTVPSTWPATARDSVTTQGTIQSWTLGMWHRYDALTQAFDNFLVGPGSFQSGGGSVHRLYDVQKSVDSGVTWTDHALDKTLLDLDPLAFANSDGGQYLDLRVRPKGPDGTGAWVALATTQWIGPEYPASALLADQTGAPAGGNDEHDLSWTAPALVGGVAPDNDGPYEYQTRHEGATTGAWSASATAAVGVYSVSPIFVPLGGVATPRRGAARVRVKTAAGDVSAWATSLTNIEP